MFTSGPSNTPHNLPASTVLQIDANISASYSGSGQTVSNIWYRPNDGDSSASTAYDFYLGNTSSATTDDPTYVSGTPSKFTVDGGDSLNIKTTTTWLSNTIRTDQSNIWWAATAFKGTTLTASTHNLIGTSNGSSLIGWRINCNSGSGGIFQFIRSDGVSNYSNTITSYNTNANLLILVYNNSTQQYKYALNSKTFSSWASTTSITVTSATSGRLCFGAANNGSGKMPNGSELYGCAMGSTDMTDEELKNTVNYYNYLHSQTYA
jgi:hypothetical protein